MSSSKFQLSSIWNRIFKVTNRFLNWKSKIIVIADYCNIVKRADLQRLSHVVSKSFSNNFNFYQNWYELFMLLVSRLLCCSNSGHTCYWHNIGSYCLAFFNLDKEKEMKKNEKWTTYGKSFRTVLFKVESTAYLSKITWPIYYGRLELSKKEKFVVRNCY